MSFQRKFCIWVFLAGIWKQYCHIWNQHPRICLISKFSEKTKIPKLGTKDALIGYFGARILKTNCDIWKQHPPICQKGVFNSYSEFWFRVSFFIRSWVHFFWRSGSRSAVESMSIFVKEKWALNQLSHLMKSLL